MAAGLFIFEHELQQLWHIKSRTARIKQAARVRPAGSHHTRDDAFTQDATLRITAYRIKGQPDDGFAVADGVGKHSHQRNGVL